MKVLREFINQRWLPFEDYEVTPTSYAIITYPCGPQGKHLRTYYRPSKFNCYNFLYCRSYGGGRNPPLFGNHAVITTSEGMISWHCGPSILIGISFRKILTIFRKQTTNKTRALNGLRTLEYPVNDFFPRRMES